MDLYSTARRITRPYIFDSPSAAHDLPIDARGPIGDGRSVALVRADGAIDWLCWPRFDSPSVFGALLDPKDGGFTSISPTRFPFESLQRYDPDTNVLETLFRVANEGVVRVTDYMPWSDDPRATIFELHRRVECLEGRVNVRVVFDPRFGYAQQTPTLDRHDHGILAQSKDGHTMAAVLSGEHRWHARERGGVQCEVALGPGERRWLVLSWGAQRPESIDAYRPFEHLRQTRSAWRNWTSGLRYDGPWRHHVLRSALLLKLLIYAPQGSMVAAPTTSLPEWIGGTRNWDYRYTWTRDAAMAIHAANRIGYVSEARDFFHFMSDALERHVELEIMYTVDGDSVPKERELAHWEGYRGSKPVRVGNGARDQLQLDTAGALFDAAHDFELYGGTLTLRTWRHLRRIAERVTELWRHPDNGIWEPRSGLQHNVHSKLMCWLALSRACRLATLFGEVSAAQRWQKEAAAIHEDVLTNGLDAKREHFVASYTNPRPDASLLLLIIHRFLPPNDPRIARTVSWLHDELGSGSFMHRYPLSADDGVGGREGSFVLCGFWLAEALAMQGSLREAQQVFVDHAEASNHLGLLAEEYDPGQGQLGNFPQAFSHLGLINAAVQIDRGLRVRDESGRKLRKRSDVPPA